MTEKAPPSTHKFAVLLTNESLDLRHPFQLRDGLELRVASLGDLAGERVTEWKEAIGDIAWRNGEAPRLVCLNTARTERPDVFDAEHDALARDCKLVWFACQLARLRHPRYGRCIVAQGHATDAAGTGISLGLMQGWHLLHNLIRPNYGGDKDYLALRLRESNWPERVERLLATA